jgi:threonine dehydratase
VISGADIDAATGRIASIVSCTPLLHSPWLSERCGADVWLKVETMQPTGSYKIRGAANAIARLRERRPDVQTIVTASAGNHGQAVAYVARAMGLRARVHLPDTAPEAKRSALKRLGAEIVAAPTYDDAEARAHEDAEASGTPYLSPYNDPDVIAGAGTVAREMLAERPEIDLLLVPLGGGGLLSGSAIAAREASPAVIVVGVEAQASPVFTSALAAGQPVIVDVHETLADGLAGNMDLDSQTFPIVRDAVDRVVALPEQAIEDAMRELILRERLVVEGAGSMGVAALLAGTVAARGRTVGIVLSGRNVDAEVLTRLLRH